jgi:hypothetical protein
MLQSMVGGETETAYLTALSRGRMRSKQPELLSALEGKVSDHHRFLLREFLDRVDYLERKIALLEEEIGCHLDPFVAAIDLLDSVPGCNPVFLHTWLAEIGTIWRSFPRRNISAVGLASVRATRRARASAKGAAPAPAIAGGEDC